MTAESRARLDRDRYSWESRWPCGRGPTAAGNHVELSSSWNGHVVSTGYTARIGHGELRRRRLRPVANREKYGSGKGYDLCICVHAEQTPSCRRPGSVFFSPGSPKGGFLAPFLFSFFYPPPNPNPFAGGGADASRCTKRTLQGQVKP